MLNESSLIGFVSVSNLDAAQRFYGEVLGLALADERPYALVAEVGDAMLRITAVEHPAGTRYTVLGWRVAEIEAMVDQLVERGVPFTHYDSMGQDDRGIWTAPGGARIAWFSDPDGNVLSLTQFA